MAKGIGEDLQVFLDAMGVETKGGQVVHPRTGALEDAAAYARRAAALNQSATGSDMVDYVQEIISPSGGSGAVSAKQRAGWLNRVERMGELVSPFSAEDLSEEGAERSRQLYNNLFERVPGRGAYQRTHEGSPWRRPSHAEAAESRLAERGYGRRQPGPLDKYLKVATPEESARTRAASEGWSEAQRARRLQRGTARGALEDAARKGFDPVARLEDIEASVRRNAPHLDNRFQRERARSMLQMIAEEYPSLASRAHSTLSTFNRLAPKALATGVAAKLMMGGAAKAAGLPGVGEVIEVAGREDPSLQQFFRDESLFSEENITGALGLPQRSQMPVHSLSPSRREAAMHAIKTGRTGLRSGFDEPPITDEEIQFLLRDMADPGNPTVSRPRYEAPKAAPRSNELK